MIKRARYGPVHRLISACAMEDYGRLTSDEQRDLRNDLTDLEERAAGNVGLDRSKAVIQLAGDTNITRWPAETDILKLVVDYPRELSAELARINRAVIARNRIRLHLAIVAGLSKSTPHGLVGDAPIAAVRLADADQWRNVRSRAHRCPVVVILDARLYQEMVKQRTPGFAPDEYAHVVVSEEKGREGAAWITAPGCDHEALAGLARPATPATPAGRRTAMDIGDSRAAQVTPAGNVPGDAAGHRAEPPADRRERTTKRGMSTPVKVALIGAAGLVAAAALPLLLVRGGRVLVLHGTNPAASPSPSHASPGPRTTPGRNYSYGPGPPPPPGGAWASSHLWSAHGGRSQWDWHTPQRGGPEPIIVPMPTVTVPTPPQMPPSTPVIDPTSPPVPTPTIDPPPSPTTTTTTNLPTAQEGYCGVGVVILPTCARRGSTPPSGRLRFPQPRDTP